MEVPGRITIFWHRGHEWMLREVIILHVRKRKEVPCAAIAAYTVFGLLLFGPVAVGAAPDYTDTWALLIGITDYQFLDDLYYPGNDVSDMHDVLTDYGGVPAGHISMLRDSAATKNGIRNAISQRSTRAGSNDLVILFFSGHGARHELQDTSPLDESDGYDETICPYDSLTYSFENDIIDGELQA